MKQIILTQGRVALVDDADFDWLNQWKWFARKTKNTWYAVRTPTEGGSVYMHRVILNTPTGIKTDHWDGDGLNNQRHNLRQATTIQNGQSFRKFRASKTILLRGVTKKRNKFRARITINKQEVYLGLFSTPELAALVYDQAALQHFGQFAHLNFPQS